MTRVSPVTGSALRSEDANLESGLTRAPDPLARTKVFVGAGEARVGLVLEFGAEHITVRSGERTFAVMDRRDFVAWLWKGGRLVAGDLIWSVEDGSTFLMIAGGRRFGVDGRTIVKLARIV